MFIFDSCPDERYLHEMLQLIFIRKLRREKKADFLFFFCLLKGNIELYMFLNRNQKFVCVLMRKTIV